MVELTDAEPESTMLRIHSRKGSSEEKPVMRPAQLRGDRDRRPAWRLPVRLAGVVVLAAATAALAAGTAAAQPQAAAGSRTASASINCPPPNPQVTVMVSDC